MHPRNIYRNPPDFTELSQSYEPLRPHVIDNRIDFKNAEAQRRLTEAIMFRDFGVSLQIPSNRLCPPVPNRLNYTLWIQDIVHAHDSILRPHSRIIRGLDIGTGASAIYSFLMCKIEQPCEMFATELDEESFKSAHENITRNDLESRIVLRKASADARILFVLEDETHFDFSMCNPPFYASSQEVADLAQDKELAPNAVCTGADIEMIYPDGGEEGFVGRMVLESMAFQTKCKWYTSMLGKMSSVQSIVELFRNQSISNYAITEFVQGQTRRWAVAWSFADMRLPDSIARLSTISTSHALYPLLPPRNTLVQHFSGCTSADLHQALGDVLHNLDNVSAMEVGVSPGPFLIEAQSNTWSRRARRKPATKRESGARTMLDKPMSSIHPALTSAVSAIELETQPRADARFVLAVQWIYGLDRPLFESFAGHIGRKVTMALQDKHSGPAL